jgi:hypothetical protein
MNLGLISLLALVLAVVLSCFTQLNVGVLSIAPCTLAEWI